MDCKDLYKIISLKPKFLLLVKVNEDTIIKLLNI